jgi:hypothetical protein
VTDSSLSADDMDMTPEEFAEFQAMLVRTKAEVAEWKVLEAAADSVGMTPQEYAKHKAFEDAAELYGMTPEEYAEFEAERQRNIAAHDAEMERLRAKLEVQKSHVWRWRLRQWFSALVIAAVVLAVVVYVIWDSGHQPGGGDCQPAQPGLVGCG